MDALFAALCHADRRRILDVLRSRPGSSVNEVCAHFDTSRIAVMKHLRVLEAADLVHSEKHGRVRRLYFNLVPIQMIHDRWSTQYGDLWARRLLDVKYKVETSKRQNVKTPKRSDVKTPKRSDVKTPKRRQGRTSKPRAPGGRRKQKGR